MRVIPILLIAASATVALSPLESDDMVFDGEVAAGNGRARFSAVLQHGRMPAGWYANIEGLDTLVLFLNGRFVATFGKGELPRTRIRGLDLSKYASLLRPGSNSIELHTGGPGRFWLRMWTSDNTWYPSNFHAHTTYSDGRYSVHDLLQLALGEGARAYAITDHNTLAQCYDTAFHPVGGLNPIRGTEWTSELGHANVLEPEGATWFDSTMSVRQMLDEASYRGGFVQINHPCDDELGFGWDRYPVLDSSIDCIEVFNNLTWFPSGPRTNDREAIAWWHSLLVQGKTIAATGNSDYHGTIPGEGGPLQSQTRAWSPSNAPDSILKYTKLGQAMVLDENDDGAIYVYADTNNNGSWDLVMGQHARVTSSRTIRFRAEVEDADFLDDFWVYNRFGTVHNYWFTNPFGPWDHAYEWTANYGAASRDFVRAYLENSINDPELATNAIYVNHPDYELGPIDLLSRTVNRPDTIVLPSPETLRFRLTNTAGFSPWRYGLAVACDTARFDIIGWQGSGSGIGQVQSRYSGSHRILEWQGGYTWSNRLSVSTSFDYWLVVRPRTGGRCPVLFRSWAHDRIQFVEYEPATGFFGPEGRVWHAESIFVRHLDVQPVSIVVPSTEMDSCGPIAPQVTVRNNGNTAVSFDVGLAIGTGYSGSANVAGLGPGTTRQVGFSTWQPLRGSFPVRCVTRLAGDCAPENDTLESSVQVSVHDAAAIAVVRPAGRIAPGAVVPQARVRNCGTDREPVSIFFSINAAPPYAESVLLPGGLPIGLDTTVAFPDWQATVGAYRARCSTSLAGDQSPANDTASLAFEVGSSVPGGWHERAPMPAAPSGRQVKDGGWLAFDASRERIYAAKGNKTADFYEYNPATDSWRPLALIPDGREAKKPGKGAVGCAADGGFIFATKGNNTLGFYCYEAASDSWRQLADVPLGASNKKVKGGTDLVCHGGSIYCLKGYMNDFYRYDIMVDSWQSLAPAPASKYDKGSWLSCDETTTIYAHQARYHSFHAYDIATGTWGPALTGMPFIGRSGKNKKSKDGGSAAVLGNDIFALKGGNTQEFWRFVMPAGPWAELETMPQLGSAGKKKKVKAGGDLAAHGRGGTGVLYALKGNKTAEFWMYTPGATGLPLTAGDAGRSGVLASVFDMRRTGFAITPNPLRVGFATLTASGQAAQWSSGPVVVSIYDASGRRVLRSSFGLRTSSLRLDLRSLPPGVYMLKLAAGSYSTTQKLIIQR
jgi:hypothetical protein